MMKLPLPTSHTVVPLPPFGQSHIELFTQEAPLAGDADWPVEPELEQLMAADRLRTMPAWHTKTRIWSSCLSICRLVRP
jgi:hypothetical protein